MEKRKRFKLTKVLLFIFILCLLIGLVFNSKILINILYKSSNFNNLECVLSYQYKSQKFLCHNERNCLVNKLYPKLKRLYNFYLEQKDYDKIIDLYDNCLTSFPLEMLNFDYWGETKEFNSFLAYNNLAYIYFKNGQIEKSQKFYDIALNISKTCSECKYELSTLYNNLCSLHLKQKDLTKAKYYNDLAHQNVLNDIQLYNVNLSYSKIFSAIGDYNLAEQYIYKLYANLPLNIMPVNSYLNFIGMYIAETDYEYGKLLLKKEEYQKAKKYLTKTYNLSNEFRNKYNYQRICSGYYLSQVSKILSEQNYDKYYDEVLHISSKLTIFEGINPAERYKKVEFICE